MSVFSRLWKKFANSKRYREEFVAAQVKRGIPFQIRTLLKKRGWSQGELAERAGLTQGVVSRAADPEYGNLTLNTIVRIAAGFDVAFIGVFVPFSKLAGWFTELSEDGVTVESFEEEDQKFQNGLSVVGSGAAEAAETAFKPVQEIPTDADVYAYLLNRQRPRQPVKSETNLARGAAQAALANI